MYVLPSKLDSEFLEDKGSFILSFIHLLSRHLLGVFYWWGTEPDVGFGLPLHLDHFYTQRTYSANNEWMNKWIGVKPSHFRSAWEPLKRIHSQSFSWFLKPKQNTQAWWFLKCNPLEGLSPKQQFLSASFWLCTIHGRFRASLALLDFSFPEDSRERE